jgi:hypothetical protein
MRPTFILVQIVSGNERQESRAEESQDEVELKQGEVLQRLSIQRMMMYHDKARNDFHIGIFPQSNLDI